MADIKFVPGPSGSGKPLEWVAHGIARRVAEEAVNEAKRVAETVEVREGCDLPSFLLPIVEPMGNA